MTWTRSLVVTVAVVLAASVLVPSPAQAGVWRRDAERVASGLGCRQIVEDVVSAHAHDAVFCQLRGQQVSVVTFRGRAQQRWWLRIVRRSPGWCVATRRGVLVEPESGQRPVARLAARRLDGRVVCG